MGRNRQLERKLSVIESNGIPTRRQAVTTEGRTNGNQPRNQLYRYRL